MSITQQWQFSYNGLVMGPGTVYGLTKATGLRDLAPQRSSDQNRGRADGAYPGQMFSGERIIQLTLTVAASAGLTAYYTALEALSTAFAPISDPSLLLPFQFWPGAITLGRPVQVTGRVTKAGTPIDKNMTLGYTNALAVEVTCPDPLVYDSVLSSVATGLPSPTSGLHFAVTFPASFGASTGGSVAVTNAGNVPTAPIITITGPCTNPVITCAGQTLGFIIALGSGDQLVIDCGAGTVTLNGTAPRSNTLAPGSSSVKLFKLPANATSSVGFGSSDAAPVTATMTVAYRSAWNWL